MPGGILESRQPHREHRAIRCVGIAAVQLIRVNAALGIGEGHAFVTQTVSVEVVGQIQLAGGALGDADRRPVEIGDTVDAEPAVHEKPLAVVEINTREVETERRVPGVGPG